MSALIGQLIDQYQVESVLGDGGMGTVYQAYDIVGSNAVALKVMHKHLVDDTALLQQFTDEIDALKRVEHEHIVKFYDSGLVDGQPYFVTELIEGIDLRGYLRQLRVHSQMMPLKDVVLLGKHIANALEHCRQHHIVHRDIKPENILLRNPTTNKINPVIIDFGLAQLLDDVPSISERPYQGSAPYMAPEMIAGRTRDARSDLYALGVILYELLTGRQPFMGKTTAEILEQHRTVVPEQPATIQAHVPPDLNSLVMRLLAKTPEDRFQTGGEIGRALGQMHELIKRDGSVKNGTYHLTSTVDVATKLEMPDYIAQIKVPDRLDLNETWYGGEYRLLVVHERETSFTRSMDKPILTIGRSPDNDIVLSDFHVSREHARIEQVTVQEEGVYVRRWRLQDLGSINGVYNSVGEPLDKEGTHQWNPEKPWRIGPYFLQWEHLHRDESAFVEASAAVINGSAVSNTVRSENSGGWNYGQAAGGGLSSQQRPSNGNGVSRPALNPAGVAAVAAAAGAGALAERPQVNSVEPGFTANLSETTVTLAHNEKKSFLVNIHNSTNTTDHLEVVLEGLPQGVTYISDNARFVPRQEKSLEVSLELLDEYALGGDHDIVVRVNSRPRMKTVATLALTIDVAAISGFQAELQPVSVSGRFGQPNATTSLQIFNNGNRPTNYQLRFSDPNNAVKFEWQDKLVTVQPKSYTTTSVTLSPATSTRPYFRPAEYQFRITAAPENSPAQGKEITGQYTIPPWAPIWLILLIGTLSLFLCVIAGLIVGQAVQSRQAVAFSTAQAATSRAQVAEELALAGQEADFLQGEIDNLEEQLDQAETEEERQTIQEALDQARAERDAALAEQERLQNSDDDVSNPAGGQEPAAANTPAPAAPSGENPTAAPAAPQQPAAPTAAATAVPTTAATVTPSVTPSTTPSPTPSPLPTTNPQLIVNQETFSIREAPSARVEIRIRLNETPTSDFEVNVSTSNGSAIAGEDFDARNDVIRLTSTNERVVIITLKNDNESEGRESFNVRLSYPTGETIITVNIIDDDSELGWFPGSSDGIQEIEENDTFVLTVAPVDELGEDVTATCEIQTNDEADEDDVEIVGSGTLSWDEGDDENDEKKCNIEIVADKLYEGEDETFTLVLRGENNAILDSIDIKIEDQDSPPIVKFRRAADSEGEPNGESGETNLDIELVLEDGVGSASEFEVALVFEGGNATEDDDFTFEETVITWPAGVKSAQEFTMAVQADALIEMEETAEFSLEAANTEDEVEFDDETMTITITDSDGGEKGVTVSTNITVTEGTAESYPIQVSNVFADDNSDQTNKQIRITATVDDGNCQLSANNAAFGASAQLNFTESIGNELEMFVRDGDDASGNDNTNEPFETCTISYAPSANYSGVTINDTSVLIEDNDVLGLVFIPQNPATSEGTDIVLNFQLNKPVEGDINIDLLSTTTSICDFDAQGVERNLTIQEALWDQNNPVTVNVPDNFIDSNVPACIITATFTNNDGRPLPNNPTSIQITVNDDDAAGIGITNEPAALLDEDGVRTFNVNISVTSQPEEEFNIVFASTDNNACQASIVEGSIDPNDWGGTAAQPYTVQVTIPREDDIDNDGVCTLTPSFAAINNADPQYNSSNNSLLQELATALTNIQVVDADTAGITIVPLPNAPAPISINEGQNAEVTFVLTSQPTSDVDIDITAQSSCTVTPNELTIDPDDWDQQVTLTVDAPDDSIDEVVEACVFNVVFGGSDTDYLANGAAQVGNLEVVLNKFQIVDNDPPTLRILDFNNAELVPDQDGIIRITVPENADQDPNSPNHNQLRVIRFRGQALNGISTEVNPMITAGCATAVLSDDYTIGSNYQQPYPVTLNPNPNTSGNFNLYQTITNDEVGEGDRCFEVTFDLQQPPLQNSDNEPVVFANGGQTQRIQIVILDDDRPDVTIELGHVIDTTATVTTADNDGNNTQMYTVPAITETETFPINFLIGGMPAPPDPDIMFTLTVITKRSGIAVTRDRVEDDDFLLCEEDPGDVTATAALANAANGCVMLTSPGGQFSASTQFPLQSNIFVFFVDENDPPNSAQPDADNVFDLTISVATDNADITAAQPGAEFGFPNGAFPDNAALDNEVRLLIQKAATFGCDGDQPQTGPCTIPE